MRSGPATMTPGEEKALEETIAGLHAVVLLGSFMHAASRPEDIAELSAGGLASLVRVPLAAVAWSPPGPPGPWRLAGRFAGEQEVPAALATPLLRLCAGLPPSRPTRLEGSQVPGRLRVAGADVLLALPLRVSTECLGFLLAGGDAASFPRDLMLIQALGAQTSTALFVGRLQESEAARVRELDGLATVLREQGERLSRVLRFQEGLIDLVLHGKDTGAIVEHLAAELGAGVWLLDADGCVVARSADQGAGPLPREPELRRALERLRRERGPVSVELTTREGPRTFLVQTVATDQETSGYLLIGSAALGVLGQAVLQGGRLVLALRLLIDRRVAEAEERAGRDLIHDALLPHHGGRTCAALAARLGYEHDGPAVVLVVGVRPTGNGSLHFETSRHHAGLAVRDVFGGGIRGIAGPLGDEMVAIVAPDDADICGRRILDRVTAAVSDLRVAVGISDPRRGLGDLEAAYREALMAMVLAERRAWSVLRFADLGLYRLLFDVEHVERVDEHVEHWLGSLFRYDAAHHTQLVETLAAYLTGSGHEEAARALAIHPSTLKYRVRRIREILGFDFAQGEARFNIELALRLDQAGRRMKDGVAR